MDLVKGKVKWFNDAKGFGFLAREGIPEDLDKGNGVFVHFSAIEMEGRRTLVEDQLVEFSIVRTEKGFKAGKVKPL
jgi:CspA family cold shock protein